MSFKRRQLKMFRTISVMVLIALTIFACGSSGINSQVNDGKITICHATGNATAPYTETTLDFNELNGHSDHQDDLIPAPVSGCPVSSYNG